MLKSVATTTTEAITIEMSDHSIHIVEINDGSRGAVEALMAFLKKLYSAPNKAQASYVVLDSSRFTLPLTSTIRQVIDLERAYPDHAPLHVAVLLNTDIAVMVDTMLRPLRNRNKIRLFKPTERERAMQWLLTQQTISATKLDFS